MVEKTEHKHSRPSAHGAKKEHHCAVGGCKNAYRAKGYCSTHYGQWRRGKYGKARYDICTKAECKKAVFRHGRCEIHHNEWWQSKHPEKAAAATA
jgi:hypothetical protein